MSNFFKEGGLLAIYVFNKPGFAARQSEKLKGSNKRKAILIDCDTHSDPKIMHLHAQDDATLYPILEYIWFNLDRETERVEMSSLHFDSWARGVFNKTNRFDVRKRLQWLSDNGLIEFQLVSTDGQQDFNNESTNEQLISTDDQLELTNEQLTPLDTPETRVALRATKTKLNKLKEIKEKTDGFDPVDKQPGNVQVLEDFEIWYKKYPAKKARQSALKAFEKARNKATLEQLLEGVDQYVRTKPQWAEYAHPATWLNAERWLDEVSESEKTDAVPHWMRDEWGNY